MLNQNRPFGVISPGYHGATFEQVGTDGVVRYYNAAGLEVDISAGGKVIEQEGTPDAPRGAGLTSRTVKARELLDQKDMRPFSRFALKAAAFIGGENPPERKDDIVAALEKIAAEEEPVVAVLHQEDEAGREAEPERLVGDERVNLLAWARGEQKYVFADVSKQILEDYAINVSTKRDAAEALISVGVVTAEECVQFPPEASDDVEGEE